MTPLEELEAQRTAVLELTWVRRAPEYGQACLVMRWDDEDDSYLLSGAARLYLVEALDEIPHTALTPVTWNDWSGRKLSQVVDLLDRAIILAKEVEGSSEALGVPTTND